MHMCAKVCTFLYTANTKWVATRAWNSFFSNDIKANCLKWAMGAFCSLKWISRYAKYFIKYLFWITYKYILVLMRISQVIFTLYSEFRVFVMYWCIFDYPFCYHTKNPCPQVEHWVHRSTFPPPCSPFNPHILNYAQPNSTLCPSLIFKFLNLSFVSNFLLLVRY